MGAVEAHRGLAVSRAQGDRLVHLLLQTVGHGLPTATLCGQPPRMLPPTQSYLTAGCESCTDEAQAAGWESVQVNDHAWINLRRLFRHNRSSAGTQNTT